MEFSQPERFYIRFTSDDRDIVGVRMKTKSVYGPDILSFSHPGDSGPGPSRYVASLHEK